MKTETSLEWRRENFLIGKDEGHIFIAGLMENADTVKLAHKSLMPQSLRGKSNNY